jgi:putative glutamine amidotransferase
MRILIARGKQFINKGNTRNYLTALEKCGAEPVCSVDETDTEGFDGLLLPGGWDIDPATYDEPNLSVRQFNAAADKRQMSLLKMFAEAGKPVMGICRGMQIINVGFGGTLTQDLNTEINHAKVNGVDSFHDVVCCEDGIFLEKLYGHKFQVNSAHHQAVKRLGKGLRVLLKAPDGIIEGLCHETLPIFGVQWHPERMDGGERLIRWFIESL